MTQVEQRALMVLAVATIAAVIAGLPGGALVAPTRNRSLRQTIASNELATGLTGTGTSFNSLYNDFWPYQQQIAYGGGGGGARASPYGGNLGPVSPGYGQDYGSGYDLGYGYGYGYGYSPNGDKTTGYDAGAQRREQVPSGGGGTGTWRGFRRGAARTPQGGVKY